MKKHVLFYLLSLISVNLLAQNLRPYKIDDSVQVSLPPDFKKIDTLGQTLITAKTSFGNIQITKLIDDQSRTPDIEKVKHLNKYYDHFLKDISKSSKYGIISEEKDTLISKLHVKDFTMAVDSGSGKQLRNFRIIHENGATYTFQFLYQDISKEYALPESKEFFNSIKIPIVDVKSQFTSPENTTGKTPSGNRKIYLSLGAALLIIAIVLYFLKRKQKINSSV
ncbi:MAG: hypothetical protein H7Y07_01985 [Pyrinomonadaceae bacterium]|nr:hypothetical protein [Sphingobacteriaceae bacterium]